MVLYREKKYVCGEYLDAYIYPVFETGKHCGGKRVKRKPSTDAQKKLNERHRKEKLARLLHANFTPDDLEIHLTYYGEQPGSDEEAAAVAGGFHFAGSLYGHGGPPGAGHPVQGGFYIQNTTSEKMGNLRGRSGGVVR